MERVKGIEPSSSAWEAAALPLSYTRRALAPWHRQGLPVNRNEHAFGDAYAIESLSLSVVHFMNDRKLCRRSPKPVNVFPALVAGVGFEPTTFRL